MFRVIWITCAALWLLGCTDRQPINEAQSESIIFRWFEYQGQDPVFNEPLPKNHYRNPILAGFYPDPSIVRVNDTYYMVNSSFSYFPGIPIFRSTDLVNWTSLGYVLDRASQMDFSGDEVSRGIFAPTIRYHQGTFYVISTQVGKKGNFIVTTKDPAAGWSEPDYLPEIDGIDPSLFFDDDGKAYVTHNGPPLGKPRYDGHRAIWQWQLNLDTMRIVKDSGRVLVDAGSRPEQNPIWIEGPHIYKVEGWYYLMCAEGGTANHHSEVIFRTRRLTEPFIPWDNNPILTQRDLDPARPNPIATAGHADLVQTPSGEWWAVFLATRNYQQQFFNTGRETYLLPVVWHDGWPQILAKGQRIPDQLPQPSGLMPTEGADPLTGNISVRDDFAATELHWQWNRLRTGDVSWYRLLPQGGIAIDANTQRLHSLQQPAFIGRRQQHLNYVASTALVLPRESGTQAGISVFQNQAAHYFLYVQKSATGYSIELERVSEGKTTTVANKILKDATAGENLVLKVKGSEHTVGFYAWLESSPEQPIIVAENQDATCLSTQKAGGFVGNYLGMHVRH